MKPDAELLDRLRRSGIRVDREGELIHEGEPVRHHGLRAALFRWMDRLPDGRYVLRLDEQRFAYLDVDDTPLVARSARWDGERIVLTLSDGSDEELALATLTIDPEGILRCWVRGGRLEARLATSAAAAIADRLTEADGRAALTSDGGVLLIPPREK